MQGEDTFENLLRHYVTHGSEHNKTKISRAIVELLEAQTQTSAWHKAKCINWRIVAGYRVYLKLSIAQAPISMLPLRAQATMNNLVETWSPALPSFAILYSDILAECHVNSWQALPLSIFSLDCVLCMCIWTRKNIIPLRRYRHFMQRSSCCVSTLVSSLVGTSEKHSKMNTWEKEILCRCSFQAWKLNSWKSSASSTKLKLCT